MNEMRPKKKVSIAKNITYSVAAQAISLCVSFVIGFIVPKFIDEYQYAYWQMFALYVGYVGVFQFGLLDGIILRYGQYDYEDIPKRKFSAQFQTLIVFFLLLDGVIVLFGRFFFTGMGYTIACLVSIGILSKNVFAYVTYLLQITNRIKQYSFVVVTQRVVHGLVIVVLLFAKSNNFVLYCISDLIGDAASIVIGVLYNKGCFFSKPISFRDNLIETKTNVFAGIPLMIANWSSMLVVGAAKMFIQWNWDELTFGKVSFSFSISNLFLTFASAVSVVLFPSIKRLEVDQLPSLYKGIKAILSPSLFVMLWFFFPGSWILSLWLPKYGESLLYLGVMLPIVVYISKVSLLTNNYLKAYRKERQLLYVNVFTVIFALICFAVSSYCIQSVDAVLISIVFAVFVRYIVSDRLVLREIRIDKTNEYLIDMTLTVVFICSARLLPRLIGGAVYLAALLIYLYINKESINALLNRRKTK